MARVKRYQQGQLASSRVGAPPLDTSGSMIASSILQSTAALSSSIIQGEGMRQQQAAHAAASAFTNVGQQLDHQRNLEYAETRRAQQHMQAVTEAAEKQRQTELTQSRTSNHSIPVLQLLNEHEAVIRQQAVANNPAASGRTYGETAPEVVRAYIDKTPELLNDPKAASDLLQLANHHIVQTQASLNTFGAKQEIDDQANMTMNNLTEIIKRSGVDSGPGLDPMTGQALIKSLGQVDALNENISKYVPNPEAVKNKAKAEIFTKWANRNIEFGDPTLIDGLLKPGKDGRPLYSRFVPPGVLDADDIKGMQERVNARYAKEDEKTKHIIATNTLDFQTALHAIATSNDFSDATTAAESLKLAQDLQKQAIGTPSAVRSASGEVIPNAFKERAVSAASELVSTINKAIANNAAVIKQDAKDERTYTQQERTLKLQAERDAKEAAYKAYVANQQKPEANYALGEVNRLFVALPSVKKLKEGATIEGAGSDKILVQLAEAQNALVAAAPYMKTHEGTVSADYRTKVTQIQNLARIVAEKASASNIKHTTLSPKNYADSFLTTLATGSNTALKAIVPHAAGMLDTHANNRYNELVKKYVDATGSEPPEGLLNDFRERVKAEQIKGIANGSIPVKPASPKKPAVSSNAPVMVQKPTAKQKATYPGGMVPAPPPTPPRGKITRAEALTMGWEITD